MSVILIILVGGIAFALAHFSHARRLKKFGAPPPGHQLGTLSFFLLWSLGYVLLGGFFPELLTGLVVVLLGLLFIDTMIFDFIRFKELPWSRRQQARDGFLFASICVLPFIVFFYLIGKGI